MDGKIFGPGHKIMWWSHMIMWENHMQKFLSHNTPSRWITHQEQSHNVGLHKLTSMIRATSMTPTLLLQSPSTSLKVKPSPKLQYIFQNHASLTDNSISTSNRKVGSVQLVILRDRRSSWISLTSDSPTGSYFVARPNRRFKWGLQNKVGATRRSLS